LLFFLPLFALIIERLVIGMSDDQTSTVVKVQSYDLLMTEATWMITAWSDFNEKHTPLVLYYITRLTI
jgi:hypothetical protein